jgi:hypothetical protein
MRMSRARDLRGSPSGPLRNAGGVLQARALPKAGGAVLCTQDQFLLVPSAQILP